METPPEWTNWAIGAAVIAFVIWISVRAYRKGELDNALNIAKPKPVEIAVVKESFQYTALGGLCILLLMLHQIVALMAFFSAKSAFQETSVASIWVGGNILLGLGIALGRRRTMTVLRLPPPVE